jgi:hypothetical protein
MKVSDEQRALFTRHVTKETIGGSSHFSLSHQIGFTPLTKLERYSSKIGTFHVHLSAITMPKPDMYDGAHYNLEDAE